MMKTPAVLSYAGFALGASLIATFGLTGAAPGQRIAFASNREGNWEIYLSDLDGQNMTRLTRRDDQDRFALWSPDGSQVAFGSQVGGDHWDLWVINVDGSNPRRVATRIVAKGHRQWSHDGKRIVFAATVEGDVEIFTAEVASGTLVRLTNSRGEDGDPAWSPDDRHIAFSSTRDGNHEIYLMRADGAQPRRLTHHIADDRSPDWSPDGSRIAFVSKRSSDGDVWVARLDDGNQQRLTIGAHATNDGARWSPDGSYLAVQASDAGYDIKLVSLSDKTLRTLVGSPSYDGQFSWSPASDQLVFISGRDGYDAVYSTDLAGRQRRITTTASLNPVWSP